MHAVLLAGGWAHPGQDLIAAVSELLTARGIDLDVVSDPKLATQALDDRCDLLVAGPCWFSMSDDRYTADQRSEHAVELDAQLARSLLELKSTGCPLLAFHTAVICFDGDPVWVDWLGGTWNWQTSWHPEPDRIDVLASAGSPLEFEPFAVIDELYQGLDLAGAAERVAESASGDPLVWFYETPSSRAAVDVLGHDARSLNQPNHRALIGQLVDRLLGGSK